MAKSKAFDLDKYIIDVCKKAKLNPNGKHIYSIPNKLFLKIVLIQNWNPLLYPYHEVKIMNEFEFIELLKNSEMEAGLMPETKLLQYIDYMKKYFKAPPYLTDILYTIKLCSVIDLYKKLPFSTFIYGEQGLKKEFLVQVLGGIGDERKLAKMTLECSACNDDILNARLFGQIKELANGKIKVKKGLVDDPSNNLLWIKEYQAATESFQKTVMRFINEGKYFRLGDSDEHLSEIILICSSTTPFESAINSESIGIKPYLHCKVDNYVFDLYPLRCLRKEIPMNIFLIAEKAKQDYNFKNQIGFPYILLEYWLKHESWRNNFMQLFEEVYDYVGRYINNFKILKLSNYIRNPDGYRYLNQKRAEITESRKKENKRIFYDLLDFVNNYSFSSYIRNRDLQPYDIIEPKEFISKPYLYYALRHFDKEKNEWDFDPETIRNILPKLSQDNAKIPIDLFSDLHSPSSPTGHMNQQLIKNSGYKEEEIISATQSKKEEYSIGDFSTLRANFDKYGQAISECDLIHNTDDTKNITIEFAKESNLQFSFLLFLIFERIESKFNWLGKSFEELKELSSFKRVCELCNLTNVLNEKKGWWKDTYNVRKKGYAFEINKKLDKKGVCGKLIEIRSRYKGSYYLNSCLEAAVAKKKT